MLCIIGTILLQNKAHRLQRHSAVCAIYGISLITLYSASTLYHSFFFLPRSVKVIFHFLDKAGIYFLIAGSYSPFLVILFPDDIMISRYMFLCVWLVAFLGIFVAATMAPSPTKSKVSLVLYLFLGHCALMIWSKLRAALPDTAMALLIGGGLTYTAGVPLFVRNRNLDHAIWHVFVLLGSVLHWVCIYAYLLEMP